MQKQCSTVLSDFRHYLRRVGLTDGTVQNYMADVKAYLDFQGDKLGISVAEITCEDVTRLSIESHLQACVPASAQRKLVALKHLGAFLTSAGLLGVDPVIAIIPPRAYKRPPDPLTEEEFEHLASAPSSTAVEGLRDRALIQFLGRVGATPPEASAVRLDDFDRRSKRVFVRTPGGKPGRVVALNDICPAAHETIASYVDARAEIDSPANELFLNDRGAALSERQIRRRISKWATDAGIRTGNISARLRGTAILHMLSRGLEDFEVARNVGFSDLTLEKYTKGYHR